ncbi:hypothetical protein KHC28_13845 [Ancylobacter sonchi]|uniref:hypothetical protein n=1 Tax=Ancylobacter sonchi TaxID=1937790 RepID=UPI001BD22CEF|nr:hypothetical protein [Ancylobacter sonchi]MBS7534742.1 hypothetical protein [Ancylobacter sonchi]
MKITAVIASVLAITATSALAEGDCAAKYRAASATTERSQAAASPGADSAPRNNATVALTQETAQTGAPATVNQ